MVKFDLSRSFPVSASRLWEVAVEEMADYPIWDRSVRSGAPVPDAKQVDGIEISAWVWETAFCR